MERTVYLVIRVFLCNAGLDITHEGVNEAMAVSHGLPRFLVPAAQVPKQTSFCQSQLKARVYNNDNAVQWLLLPQARCGVVEDLGVYVVIVGVVWPAGKWHHHILGQGRKCCCNKFLFQIIRRWHVPQQALDWQKVKTLQGSELPHRCIPMI